MENVQLIVHSIRWMMIMIRSFMIVQESVGRQEEGVCA